MGSISDGQSLLTKPFLPVLRVKWANIGNMAMQEVKAHGLTKQRNNKHIFIY
jgi:hypothetical protein